MKDYQDIIKTLGLEVIEKMPFSLCVVYKVKEGDYDRVLKMSFDEESMEHVTREYEVLETLQGLDCIPKAIRFYEECPKSKDTTSFSSWNFFYWAQNWGQKHEPVAFLKEYIEGRMMEPGDLLESMYKEALISVVSAAHKAGFAGLELKTKNIIITPSKKPYIIDLGSLKTEDECFDFNEFKLAIEGDMIGLERLIGLDLDYSLLEENGSL